MSEFIKKLRAFAIELYTCDESIDIFRHVAAIEQNEKKLGHVIEDIENKLSYNFYLVDDSVECYSDYKINVHMIEGNGDASLVTYQFNLEDRMDVEGSYCACEPTDELYDEEHQCCGIHCDRDIPVVNVIKIEHVVRFEYVGIERELWDYEREIKKDLPKVEKEVEDDKLEYILNDLSNEELRKLQEKILNRLNEVR